MRDNKLIRVHASAVTTNICFLPVATLHLVILSQAATLKSQITWFTTCRWAVTHCICVLLPHTQGMVMTPSEFLSQQQMSKEAWWMQAQLWVLLDTLYVSIWLAYLSNSAGAAP